MKKILFVLTAFLSVPVFAGDCGPGYVLATHAKVDGMNTMECQKLWCVDLETGKPMGKGDRAANGYTDTKSAGELCDANGKCIECFGERKWCSGVPRGVWNAEYGAYTRGGVDSATYTSEQKGGCFSWKLEKPKCDVGQDAILKDGEWICSVSKTAGTVSRASALRRTGIQRRWSTR